MSSKCVCLMMYFLVEQCVGLCVAYILHVNSVQCVCSCVSNGMLTRCPAGVSVCAAKRGLVQ